MPFGLIAIGIFWVAAIKLWVTDGAKIPLIFIGLWIAGRFAFPMLHAPAFAFMVYQCLLVVILLTVDKYKSSL